MNIVELAIELASEDYQLGSIVQGYPWHCEGVWKKMDGG